MKRPLVSVIIPVYNDPTRLSLCLEYLAEQTYPKERFEILVVDNGSDVSVEPIVRRFANAKYIYESKAGSYTARNRGLGAARGDILAFTDSDCRPDKRWIEKGVEAVERLPSPGLIAGRIKLFFANPRHPTWVELYEQEFAFRQEENVGVRHYGATANVFSSKAVFDQVGRFDSDLKSGGDHEWGNRVHAAGFPLRYDNEVVVEHPARRRVVEYFAKLDRTIYGHYALRDQSDKANLFRFSRIARRFLPPRSVWRRIGQSGAHLTPLQKVKVASFVVVSRYYCNLLCLKLAILKDVDKARR